MCIGDWSFFPISSRICQGKNQNISFVILSWLSLDCVQMQVIFYMLTKNLWWYLTHSFGFSTNIYNKSHTSNSVPFQWLLALFQDQCLHDCQEETLERSSDWHVISHDNFNILPRNGKWELTNQPSKKFNLLYQYMEISWCYWCKNKKIYHHYPPCSVLQATWEDEPTKGEKFLIN